MRLARLTLPGGGGLHDSYAWCGCRRGAHHRVHGDGRLAPLVAAGLGRACGVDGGSEAIGPRRFYAPDPRCSTVDVLYQATVRLRPSSNETVGSYPRIWRAFPISACESRTSTRRTP